MSNANPTAPPIDYMAIQIVGAQTAALGLMQSFRRMAGEPAWATHAPGFIVAAEMCEKYADGVAPVYPTRQQSASYDDAPAGGAA